MRIRYFEDTDTLLIEFKEIAAAETRDLDDDIVVDLDGGGNASGSQSEGLATHRAFAILIREGGRLGTLRRSARLRRVLLGIAFRRLIRSRKIMSAKMARKSKTTRKAPRDIFAEVMDGMGTLAASREGKTTLPAHPVEHPDTVQRLASI